MTETEFRLQHSKIIMYYQLIEMRLKGICAMFLAEKLTDWYERLRTYASDTMWGLIKKLQEIQKSQKVQFFSDDDFSKLNQIRKRRNYWCHECFGGESPVVFKKQADQSERVVKNDAYAVSLRDDIQEAVETDRWLAEELGKLQKMRKVTIDFS